jgi:hypothetical protein
MRFSRIVLTNLAILVATSVAAPAAVLCTKKSGVVVMREACKPRETALDPAALGLQGAKGDQGDPGNQGPPGAQGPGAQFAIVAADATIVAQSGGITASALAGPQLMRVNMGADVSNKTIQVSNGALTGDTGLRGPITFALCGTAPTAMDCTSFGVPNDNQTILVATTTTAAANQLHAFHIAVF